MNGYPLELLAKYINVNWVYKETKREPGEQPKSLNSNSFITVPYIKGATEPLRNHLRHQNLKLVSKSSPSLKLALQAPAPNHFCKPTKFLQNVIYSIPCDHFNCLQTYVGTTKQCISKRLSSHKSDLKLLVSSNSLVQHYKKTGHKPNLSATRILFQIPQYRARYNLETLCIKLKEPPVHNHIQPTTRQFDDYVNLFKSLDMTRFIPMKQRGLPI